MKTDTETLDLIKKVREGNDDAFALLAAKYRTVTESLVTSFVGTSGESGNLETLADDLRQEATLALYRAAQRYDPEGDGKAVTFGLYAKICIRNALISDRRRRTRSRRKAQKLRGAVDSGNAVAAGGDADTAEAVVNRMELDGLMKRAGEVLSAYEAQVLSELIKGRSVREIAGVVGRSEKSVSNAVYRIKVKLKGMRT